MKALNFLIFILLTCLLQAQTPVLNLHQDTLYLIFGGQILNTKKEAILSNKGNILFKGTSSNYKDILYTLALDSFNQKKAAKIYAKNGAESKFSVKENTIFYQQSETAKPIATFVQNEDNWAIYNNLNDSLLAYIPNLNLSNAQLFGIYVLLFKDENIRDQLTKSTTPNEASVNGLSYVAPVFGNGIVWVWDGKYLYPYGTNVNNPMTWVFENDKLNPKNYPRTQEEWAWDGSGLKPYWGGNPQTLWTWQNGVLRQVWNNNYKNEYFIEENVVRKRFGNYGDNEWEINGNVPLPIVTAIVLGILYR